MDHWLSKLLVLDFDQEEIRKQLRSDAMRRNVAKILDVFFATVFYMNLPISDHVESDDPAIQDIWAFVFTIYHFPFANVLNYPTDRTITPDFKKKIYMLYQNPLRSSEGVIGDFTEAQRHQLQLWRLLKYARVGQNQSLFAWRILNEADEHQIALIQHFVYFLGNEFCDILLAHMRLNTVLALTEKMLAVARSRDGIERECLLILVRYYEDIKIDLLDEEKKAMNELRFDRLRRLLADTEE